MFQTIIMITIVLIIPIELCYSLRAILSIQVSISLGRVSPLSRDSILFLIQSFPILRRALIHSEYF